MTGFCQISRKIKGGSFQHMPGLEKSPPYFFGGFWHLDYTYMRLFPTMATMCVVNVHKSTKVTKAKAHIAHRNVFLINFFTFSTHRPSSNCWNEQWTCAASFYGWRYSCCYCDTHAFLQKSDTGNAWLRIFRRNIWVETLLFPQSAQQSLWYWGATTET